MANDNPISVALSQETRDRLQELSRSMVPDATRKQMQAIGRSMADRLPKVKMDESAAGDLLSNVKVATEILDTPVVDPASLVDPVHVRQLAVLESINERLEAAEEQLRGTNERLDAAERREPRNFVVGLVAAVGAVLAVILGAVALFL